MKFGVLQITDSEGRRRDLPLDLPSLVVGRADGNAIVLDDLTVSRRHARLTVDSGHLLVEDLGSAQGTFINGVRIAPNVPNLVEDDAELRFGDVAVRFEPPPPTELQLQPGAISLPGEADGARGEDFAIASRLGVTLMAPNAPVIAGAPWIATLRVHNRSNVVDRVVVSVPDLPAGWVRLDRPELALPPGAVEIVQLTIIPPRKAESLAGDYDFTVQVSSFEHQREASTLGQFTLAPFQNIALGFEAPRSRRDFRVVAENRGNEAATYTLEGEDADAAYRYEFELPAVNLQPGERRIIGLRVHHKTRMLGVPMALPFNVHAESDGPNGQKVTVLGQLATRPPLQKFVAPAMFVVAVGAIALVAVAILLLRSDSVVTSANAEAKFSGVHMCDKDEAAKAQARQKQEDAAVPKPGGASALVSGTDPGAPYFAQNDPRWGKDEYAKAKDPEFGPDWCGSTIEQCGCAMTSVATTMALFGLLTMPDGKPLTPEAMNTWFNEEANKTSRGWVSRGYVYGDVIWTAANQLSGEMAKVRPGTPTIRFSRTGNGSDDEVKEQLKQGRPIILEVPGHWIAAVGLDGDSILINDPYYRDRKTLDVYKGKVKSSVIFEPSDDLSAVVFTAPSDVRVRITDKQGRVVGSLATGTADDAAKGAVNQIPGASYSTRQAWRDPSCIESAPPPDAGTNQIILSGSADDYKIEVLDASGKPTSITIHTYDKKGKSSVQTIDNPGSAVAQLSVDPAAGKADVKVIAGGLPTPEKTTTGGGGGGNLVPTVAAAATATATRAPSPTATPEPAAETNISIGTIPGDQFVAIQNSEGFLVGDQITFSPGKANEEDNRIVGFGSFILETPLKFAHSPGETIKRKPRLPGQGPGSGGALPPPVTIPPLTAPENLLLGCSAVYSVDPHEATLICTLDITGPFTTTRWSANGKLFDEFNNQQLLIMSFTSDGQAAVGATVCNRTICKSTSASQKIQFPAPGTTTGLSGGPGSTGGPGSVPAPAQTPPATGVIVNCSTQFEQGTNPRAVVTCGALFSGPSTSISWTAPGAVPAAGQGKTFTTDVMPNTVNKLRVTATVCNFAICQTSPNVDVSIGGSKTTAALKSKNVALGATTTFTAIVTGPVPPAGGTIQFRVNTIPVGLSASIFTAGSLGFAQVTLATGFGPLDYTLNPTKTNTADVSIDAVYSGGTNLFGSTSAATVLTLVPPIEDGCDSVNNNLLQEGTGPFRVDENCLIAQTLDLGGGTIIGNVAVTGPGVRQAPGGSGANDVIVVPGGAITISGSGTRAAGPTVCAGCIRQIYLGIGGNAANVPVTPPVGPQCVYSGGLGELAPGVAVAPWTVSAPSIPGLYYVRATATAAFTCQPQSVGPPDQSVARLLVQASTSTTTVVTLSPPIVPQDGTVTATVTVDPPEARGFVQFTDNGVPIFIIPAPKLTTSNTATVSFPAGPAGLHEIRAKFLGAPENPLGDPNFRYYFTPTALSEQRVAALTSTSPSTTTLDPLSPASITVGGTVNVRVRVTTPSPLIAPEATVNGGTVTLRNNGVSVQTLPLAPAISGGTASAEGTTDFSFIAGDIGVANAGSHTLTATYNGTTYVAPSTSGTQPLTITKTTPSIVLGTTNPVSPGLEPNPVSAGSTLTLRASVTGALFASPDGGTVEFRSGATVVGTATVTAGVATASVVSTSGLLSDAGSYPITATFMGNTNLNPSPSTASQTLTVLAAPVTVTLTAPAGALTAGGSGSLTAALAPVSLPGPGAFSTGICTGPFCKVTFSSNEVPILGGGASAVLASGPPNAGQATLLLNLLNAGTYTNVVATFNGDAKYAGGASAPMTLVIGKATSAVTVTPPAATTLGSTVTLTATVADSGLAVLSPAGGTVRFLVNGVQLCGPPLASPSCPTIAAGSTQASLTIPTGVAPIGAATSAVAPVVAYTITAEFLGDATNNNLTAATSAGVTLTVARATPSPTVSFSPVAPVIGASIVFTANVPGSGSFDPAGATVQFEVNGTAVCGAIPLPACPVVTSNSATLTVPSAAAPFDFATNVDQTTPALYSITAVYGGNANLSPATSPAQALTFIKAASSVTLDPISPVSPTPTLGDALTFTAHVTGAGAGSLGPDGGTVTFKAGGVAIGTPQVVASGTAVLVFTTNVAPLDGSGPYVITAEFNGTRNLALSATASSQSLILLGVGTTVTLTMTTATPQIGDSNTFTAVVAVASNKGPIAGTVTFTTSTGGPLPGTTTINVGDVTGGRGATYDASSLPVGAYSITASYHDNRSKPKYSDGISSPAAALTVSKANSGVTLTLPAPSPVGSDVTLIANVAGTGLRSPVGGTVQFLADGSQLCGAPLVLSCPAFVGAANQVSLLLTTGATVLLDAKNYNITATFSGNTNVNASSTVGAQTLTLTKVTPVPTVSVSPSSPQIGANLTFTATIPGTGALNPATDSSGGATPPTVTFMSGGSALCGSVPLAACPVVTGTTTTFAFSSAVTPFDFATAADGVTPVNYSITAVYGGNANLNAATSAAQLLSFTKATSTATLDPVSPASAALGTSITLTARVTGSGTINPTGGTVTFKLVDGTQVGAPQTVAADGSAQLVFATNNAPLDGAGAYSISATFNGTRNLGTSNVAANQPVTIAAIGSTVTMTMTTATPTVGQTNTITAIVTSASNVGSIDGTITFQDLNGATLPNNVLTVSSITGGRGAQYDATGLPARSYNIQALYTDTRSKPKYTTSGSSPQLLTIAQVAPSSITMTGIGSFTIGTSLNITVTVNTPSQSPTGGTVSLYVGSTGGTAISTQTVSGNTASFSGITTGSGQFPNVGTYGLVARFNGNATNGNVAAADSSGTNNVILTKVTPTVSITSGTGSFALGTPLNFVVHVTAGVASPDGGTVTLRLGSTTGPVVATATVSGNDATFTPIATGSGSFANAGTYSNFAATFEGDTNINVGSSPTPRPDVTLTPVAPTVTVTSSAATGTTSTTFTFTATVTPNFAPAGTVQFRDNSTDVGALQTLSSGNSVQISGVTLAVGSHTITAVYTNTSGNYTNTPSYVTVTITIT